MGAFAFCFTKATAATIEIWALVYFAEIMRYVNYDEAAISPEFPVLVDLPTIHERTCSWYSTIYRDRPLDK